MADAGQNRDAATQPALAVVIPTFGRERVLIETLGHLLALPHPADEILVIDQTEQHEPKTRERLEALLRREAIRWVRHQPPSIPAAMNRGLLDAKCEIILFLDDDVVPDPQLVSAHLQAHSESKGDIIAGRVLQPWHGDEHDTDLFTKKSAEFKDEFIGCNFSVRRERLLALGGFDQNFKGAAYHFEREFADRLLESGHTIWYEPTALIRHLHHATGGTRSKGDHLTSWNPRHPVGAYYYLFVSPRVKWRAAKALQRMCRSILTRHHLKAPWYIPVTLVAEVSGLAWALWLRLKGPALPFANERYQTGAA